MQKYLNQIPTWCERWGIKLNPEKLHLLNFSQRNAIKDTSLSIYGHLLKVTDSIKLLGVHIDKHLSMKLQVEHIEKASLISTMIIIRLNSTNATLLIRFYKIWITHTYMDYACTALTALNKTQTQTLGVNRCLRYGERVVDSNCISNNGLRSRCNIVSVE